MKKNFFSLKFHLKNVRYYSLNKINLKNVNKIIKNINEINEKEREILKANNIVNEITKLNEKGSIENIVNSDRIYKDDKIEKIEKIKLFKLKNFKLIALCIVTTLFFYFTLKKVPDGYICLVENINDKTVLPYIYDDKMTFFYNPLKYKVIHMRIVPIQKKYVNIYETLDKKKIKVILEVKMKPKIPFIIEIYNSFGINYSSKYIEKEMNLDIKSVVKKYKYDLFFEIDENTNKNKLSVDDIVDQIMERFYDCSIFHKIILIDATILFQKVD
ncbi:prohibitin-like protein, putative [Plasmodium relictum]|uniref:Prohibitin-like protein, putative n=1 Tax=Plasmodium relictum TaxID=85471 RepID=A0A1J1H5T3_PLARL|nr:prohibitin-like protein, putative [Plasmodium relictum]CRG98961.1 prohibitin-like protein, putative [Plasmodium relictum]